MKRLGLLLLIFTLVGASSASADWRWAKPHFKHKVKVRAACDSYQCHKVAKIHKSAVKQLRVTFYHKKKRLEWRMWTSLYIPDCTWYGESGEGPEYARYRYTMPNSLGSGALGKFQFKPGTYHNRAKYHDWSPLDQEIAARREYWKHGTAPWEACH